MFLAMPLIGVDKQLIWETAILIKKQPSVKVIPMPNQVLKELHNLVNLGEFVEHVLSEPES